MAIGRGGKRGGRTGAKMTQDNSSGHEGGGSDGTGQEPGSDRRGLTRRRVLVAAGAASAIGVAGCTGSGGNGDGRSPAPSDGSTPTDGQAADEWRTYQRDNRNTGYNPNAGGPAAKPTVEWKGSVGHTDGPATVVDGVVYVGGPEKVYAYDPGTGEEQWTYEVGEMTDAAVTVADGTAVFPSRAGKVHALSAADGSEQWVRSEVNGNTIARAGDLGIKQGSVTVADGTVYVSAKTKRRESFYGLDLATGEVQLVVDGNPVENDEDWATDRGKESFTNTPAIADGTAYLGAESGNVYAVDLESGTVTWARVPEAKRDESIGSVFGSPAVVDGTVYLTNHAQGSSNGPVLYALDAASGETRWSYELGPKGHGSRSVGSVCVAHDAVIASNRNGVLHAVERADGAERWTYDTGARIYGAASADAERVYVGNDGGTVYALDPDTGDLNWKFGSSAVKNVDAAPTPVGGTLYVTSDDGSLVALTEP